MGKAYIFNQHLTPEDRAAIELAISQAGYEPVYGIPSDISALHPDSDIGVIGLPFAPEDEAVINDALKTFGGAGIRVVAIWLRKVEAMGSGTLEGIEKYGFTTVEIDSPDLVDALQGKAAPWESSDGSPRETPTTKRNKC